MSMHDMCPICGSNECQGYPLMWQRYAEGRDRAHWKRIHDQLNGIPDYPPILEQIGNFAGAMVDAAKTGFKQVDEEERERRLSICRECEFFDKEQFRCKKCTCYLQLKSRLEAWHCPIQKWIVLFFLIYFLNH